MPGHTGHKANGDESEAGKEGFVGGKKGIAQAITLNLESVLALLD